MTRECNENDERRITLSGTAKQVDFELAILEKDLTARFWRNMLKVGIF